MKEKKWELIAKAYQEYPKGTKVQWGDITFELDGKYKFFDVFTICDGKGNWVYNGLTSNKWAEIITDKPKSILDGKIVVKVSNAKEQKLINDYKGTDTNVERHYAFPAYFYLDKNRGFDTKIRDIESGYKRISFDDFAKEVSITVPEFILTSEDGVRLYEGDKFWSVRNEDWENESGTNNWEIKNSSDEHTMNFNSVVVVKKDNNKAFSTKEAALAWIEEANKPKEVVVHLGGRDLDKVVVSKGTLKVRHLNGAIYLISAYELESIYKSYQSLQ